MVSAIGAPIKKIGEFGRSIKVAGGLLKWLTSPANIAIMVVAAIAVAAFLIIKNWSKVKVFLANVKDWFSNAFEKAKDIVEKFKEKFEQVKEAVQPITSALSEDFKRCVDA